MLAFIKGGLFPWRVNIEFKDEYKLNLWYKPGFTSESEVRERKKKYIFYA